MRGTVVGLSCLLAAGAVAVPRGGAALQPGVGAEEVRGTHVGVRPELAGVVLRDALIDFEVLNAAGKVVSAGKVQDRVVLSRQDKALTFYFRIRDTKPDLPGRVTEVRREGFAGWKADAEYRVDGLGKLGPDRATRGKPVATVWFWFGKTPVTPGSDSRFCFVHTDATEFDPKAGSLVVVADDGSKVTLPVAAPTK